MAGQATPAKVGSFEISTSLRRDVSGRAGTGPDDLKYTIPDDFVLLENLLKAMIDAINRPEYFITVNVDSTNTIVSVEGPEEARVPLETALEVTPSAASPRTRKARAGKASAKKAPASKADPGDDPLPKKSKK